jgi:PAS domain S-box-containing protein
MKIRTQLLAGLAVFGLLLVIITGLVFTTNQQVEHLTNQEEMANTIALEVGELSYLSNDYILYREPQQAERWNAKFASLSGHAAGLTMNDPEQQAIVGNLKASLRNTRSIFDEIVASPVQPGGSGQTGFVQLSWSRMAVQNQGMVFDAGRLARLLREQADGLRQASLLLISSLVVAFGAFLLTSYFVFYRRTLMSIAGLQEGARVIGSGSLDHLIDEKGDDEIGDLSRAFNRMAASLKTVTASKSDLETEIAERKRAEETIRRSEERLRNLYGAMIEGLAYHEMVYDGGKAADYVITDVNPAYERILGLARADVVGRRASEIYGTGSPPYLEIYEKVASGGPPESFETYFPPMERHFAISVFSPEKGRIATIFQDITDRKRAEEAERQLNADLVRQAEELQAANEALKASRRAALNLMEDALETRDALQKSEARYRTVANNTYDWEFWLDPAGKFLYCSPSCEMITGHKADEFLADPELRRRIIHPGDRAGYEEHQREVHDKHEIGRDQWRYLRPDGTSCWIEHVCRPIFGEKGEFLGTRGSNRDITDRKRAEQALQESEGRFRAIAETSPVQISVSSASDGLILFTNTAYEQAFGFSRGELIGKMAPDLYHDPADRRALIDTLEKEGVVRDREVMVRRKDGTPFWIAASVATIRFGGREAFLGASLDITDRKQAEVRIAHLASFPELNPNPILELDASGEMIYSNPACTRTLADLGLGTNPDLFLPKDIRVMLPRLLEGDVVEEVKVGGKVFLETITLNPATRTTRIYARDITERKQAEEALRETSEYLEKLINYANAPIIVWDPGFHITRFNHAFERLTGRTAEEVVGKGLEILFPSETVEGSMDHIRKAMAGERWEVVEIPIIHRDGSVRTVLWNSAILYEPDGRTVSSAIAQGQDITDRKQMEEELHDTSQYLENLINYANAPIIVWDPEFRITRFNHAFERLTGRSAEEVTGKSLEILLPEETAAESMDLIRKAMAGERWEIVEIPVLHRDGGIRTVLWNSATLYEADGVTASSAIAQGMDITEQKRMVAEIARKATELADTNAELSAEIAQRKRAEVTVSNTLSLLHAALESTADAMLVVDKAGRITGYNRNFTTMWNMPESVLTTLDTRAATEYVSIQTRDPDGFMARIQEIPSHPSMESYDMLELLDGRIIERYSKPQKIGNSIVGRVYSFRDITERKRAELRLIESLNEKEVLLREIHHRVKNNLQLTTSLLDMTRMRTRDPGTGSILTDVMMKIQTMAQIHTRLYESKQFDRINMDRQIRDQVQALTNIYSSGDREILTEIDSPELYLPLDKAIPCALALNEILSNAYKHAFKGRKSGTVKYSAREEDGRIRFAIADNGIGLPRGFDLSRANTLGLKLVRTLVEQQLKGTLRIKRKGGTEVIVELPLRREEGEHV